MSNRWSPFEIATSDRIEYRQVQTDENHEEEDGSNNIDDFDGHRSGRVHRNNSYVPKVRILVFLVALFGALGCLFIVARIRPRAEGPTETSKPNHSDAIVLDDPFVDGHKNSTGHASISKEKGKQQKEDFEREKVAKGNVSATENDSLEDDQNANESTEDSGNENETMEDDSNQNKSMEGENNLNETIKHGDHQSEAMEHDDVPNETTDDGESAIAVDPLDQAVDAAWNRFSPTKRTQIENYRNKTALILNFHATHHAGTTICKQIGRHGIDGGIAPSFACMGDRDEVMPRVPDCRTGNSTMHLPTDPPFCYSYPEMSSRTGKPWRKEQTGPFVQAIRPYFHMISWEFSSPPKIRSMDEPDWEFPELSSVVVTRDPVSRLLAGDANSHRDYAGYQSHELSHDRWWDFAVYDQEKNTDNFFLRILTTTPVIPRTKDQKKIPNHIREGVNRTTDEIMELFPTGINETHFEQGKALLDRFAVVPDIACLEEGMDALARMLGLELPAKDKRMNSHPKVGNTSQETIGCDDVCECLLAKNHWDIALCEHSKTIGLVQCGERE